MKIELKTIDLKEKIKDFAQYLTTTDRIILSAKFGDGKTYLLNQLRSNEELSKDYKFFTIYPVNYSVAKNEDIFEYINLNVIFSFCREINGEKKNFCLVTNPRKKLKYRMFTEVES